MFHYGQTVKTCEMSMIIISNKLQHPQQSYINVNHQYNNLNLLCELRKELIITCQFQEIQILEQRHKKHFQLTNHQNESYKFFFGIEFLPIVKFWVKNYDQIYNPSDLLKYPLAESYLLLWSFGNMLKNGQQLNNYYQLTNEQNLYLEFIFLLFKNIMDLEKNLTQLYETTLQTNKYLILKQEQKLEISKVSEDGQFNLYIFFLKEEELSDDFSNYTMEKEKKQIKQKLEILKENIQALLNQEYVEILSVNLVLFKNVSKILIQDKNYNFTHLFEETSLKLNYLHRQQLHRFKNLSEKIIAENSRLIESYREQDNEQDEDFDSKGSITNQNGQ